MYIKQDFSRPMENLESRNGRLSFSLVYGYLANGSYLKRLSKSNAKGEKNVMRGREKYLTVIQKDQLYYIGRGEIIFAVNKNQTHSIYLLSSLMKAMGYVLCCIY